MANAHYKPSSRPHSLPANSSLLNSQLARSNVLDHREDLGKVVERGERHALIFAVGDEICVEHVSKVLLVIVITAA